MKFTVMVTPMPIEDRSRNVKYDGWHVSLRFGQYIDAEPVFERTYHSTRCEGKYAGYDGKAFNEKDAIKQTRVEFAQKLKELLK